MSLVALISRPCVLVRRSASGADIYGNDSLAETLVQTVCEVQQRRRTEPGGEGQISDTEWVGFFLPTETLDTGDALEVDGHRFEVSGDPWKARNPRTQTASHVEATLTKTAGSEDAS